jgi:hypothetical protein
MGRNGAERQSWTGRERTEAKWSVWDRQYRKGPDRSGCEWTGVERVAVQDGK